MNPQYYKEEEIDAMFAGFNPPIPTLDEVLISGNYSDRTITIETNRDRAIIGNSLDPTGIGVYGYSNMWIGIYASSDEGIGLKSLGKINAAIFDMLGEGNINDIVKFQNNGVNKVIIKSDGRITASPAILSNEVVVKSQLETAIRPYKVYTALLTQSGTNAPTAIVLENTLGVNVTYAYNITGEYIGTATGALTQNKTAFLFKNSKHSAPNYFTESIAKIDVNTFVIGTQINGVFVNGNLNQATIEIRVYNNEEPI